MKFFAAVLLFVIVAHLAYSEVINGDGQPGCKTEKELEIGVFRNNWDPTRYWNCTELGQPGVVVRCPEQTGFLDSIKKCIDWIDWQWTEPQAPLSQPDQENLN